MQCDQPVIWIRTSDLCCASGCDSSFFAVRTVIYSTIASADLQGRLLCHRPVRQQLCAQKTFEPSAKQQDAIALRSPPKQRRAGRLLRCAAAASGADIGTLQSKFGIPEHVEVTTGEGGLPVVRLTHTCGASAEVKPRPVSLFLLFFLLF